MRDNDRIRDRLSRRRYAQLLAATGVAGLAGCGGGDGEGTTVSGGDGGTATDTSEDDGTDTGGDTDTPSGAETRPPDSERQTDTVRVYAVNTPGEFDWNPFAPADNSAGDLWLAQLDGIYHVEDTTIWRGSPTFEVPHVTGFDEIEVVTWLTGYEVEPPYDIYHTHDDRCTYWNGEPYDAEARELFDRVRYYNDGNKFIEGSVHRQEALSQWEYHLWRAKGEVPGAEPDPANQTVLESDARRSDGNFPLPPDWSEPWIQRFDAAGTQESYDEVINQVRGDRISLERLADEGWGTAPYAIESPDDVSSDSVVAQLRDEHPISEHANIDTMQIHFGNEDREDTLAGNGEIDIHEGSVTPNNRWNPDLLPDHMLETLRYLKTDGGDSLWINMNNPHLENLWVRRALVTRINWEQAGANGWGQERSIPLEYDTGMLDTLSAGTFSEDFLNSLYTWPKQNDNELAAEFMRNGGYERQGGNWVGPDGNEITLEIQTTSAIQDWTGAGQTIRQNLREFGWNVTFSQYDWSTWSDNLNTFEHEPNFDMSIHWDGRTNPFDHYKSQAAWWDNGSLLDGDPNGTGGDRRSVDADDDYTIRNQPVQAQIPAEVGSIEAPTGPDAAPNNPADLDAAGIDSVEVNMAEIFNNLIRPADDQEAVQERFRLCARYYNYYLPKFIFHQYTYGTWGNVRDFDWPPEGHESQKWGRSFNNTDVMTQGGILQASYDDDFDR